MPYYDSRIVPSHGGPESTVFFVNEAPGPCEAHYGIPSVGAQGGNIFWALRKAQIPWAMESDPLPWPRKILECYKEPSKVQSRFERRDAFLQKRAKYITCSNAYPQWPRTDNITCDWQDPAQNDVLKNDNLERLKREVHRNHKVILVCGEYAWMACLGTPISKLSEREGSVLCPEELSHINGRLSSDFQAGWYMGHTRRWSLNAERISKVLKEVAKAAGWS